MRHELTIDGFAFRLRPVRQDDAAWIVDIRSSGERVRYLHPVPPDVHAQEMWLEAYFNRPQDWYFVVENRLGGAPEGLVAIYDTDVVAARAEWGRWVLKPGSLAAVENAWLVYRMGFEILRFQALDTCTVVENSQVVSFHDTCGLERREVLAARYHLRGQAYDAVVHRMTVSRWGSAQHRLAELARRVADRLRY